MNTRKQRKEKPQKQAENLSFSYTPEKEIGAFLIQQKNQTGASYKWQLDQAMRLRMDSLIGEAA